MYANLSKAKVIVSLKHRDNAPSVNRVIRSIVVKKVLRVSAQMMVAFVWKIVAKARPVNWGVIAASPTRRSTSVTARKTKIAEPTACVVGCSARLGSVKGNWQAILVEMMANAHRPMLVAVAVVCREPSWNNGKTKPPQPTQATNPLQRASLNRPPKVPQKPRLNHSLNPPQRPRLKTPSRSSPNHRPRQAAVVMLRPMPPPHPLRISGSLRFFFCSFSAAIAPLALPRCTLHRKIF